MFSCVYDIVALLLLPNQNKEQNTPLVLKFQHNEQNKPLVPEIKERSLSTINLFKWT
jgi:hypothetical protein